MIARHALILSLFTAGCAGTAAPTEEVATEEASLDSGCPTAHTWGPLSHLFWRTTRQLEHVVWSSDGKQIGASELVFEEKLSWDPLNGTTDKRKFCHQLSIRDLKGSVSYVGAMQPNQVVDLTFMQPAGYFTIQSFVHDLGGWDYHRVALDGTHVLLAHVDASCQYGRVLPSPDGKTIAYVNVTGHCTDGLSGSDVTVTFFDGATAAKLATSPTVSLPGSAFETWTPAGNLIVSDGTKAVRVPLDGSAVVAAPVPHCTDPGTTSSTIDAMGRTLGFDDKGQPTIVSTDPSTAFGCQ
jgi:hypothetical protein